MTGHAPSADAALAFLDQRRSVPARQLGEPGPDTPTLLRLLAAASRVPDHGKRVPFRFIQVSGANRDALGQAVADRGRTRTPDAGPAAYEKDRQRFSHAPLVLVVVAILDPDDAQIPERERLLTAGSVCFATLQAAQALGFGATWLTGWPAFDAPVAGLLGLTPHEHIAGFIHIGTPALRPPERERPDSARLLQVWQGPAA